MLDPGELARKPEEMMSRDDVYGKATSVGAKSWAVMTQLLSVVQRASPLTAGDVNLHSFPSGIPKY